MNNLKVFIGLACVCVCVCGCVCRFLYEVQSYSDSNKMSDQNLATVFGPNILRAKAEDPQSIMGGRKTNWPNLYEPYNNIFSETGLLFEH